MSTHRPPTMQPGTRARRAVWGAIALLGCGLASAAGDRGSGFDPVLAEIGEPLFRRHCASCHGADARGGGPVAIALVMPPADLTKIAARRGGEFPDAKLALFIDGRFELPAHGSREMPVWGVRFGSDVPDPEVGESIARGNIASLVEFLKSIQDPPLAPRSGAP